MKQLSGARFLFFIPRKPQMVTRQSVLENVMQIAHSLRVDEKTARRRKNPRERRRKDAGRKAMRLDKWHRALLFQLRPPTALRAVSLVHITLEN